MSPKIVVDLPSAKVVREFLDYDPATGILTWRQRGPEWFSAQRYANSWNTSYANTVAGWTNNAGYRHLYLFKRKFLAHRVIWLWMTGDPPAGEVDHIDHNRLNNRWKNLRVVSIADNGKNRPRQSNNTSSVTGVTWHASGRKWQAQIAGKYLGLFATFEEAVAARLAEQKAQGYHPNHGTER